VGSTFVWASALDWARFGLLLAQDGVRDGRRVLPEGWVDYMGTPAPSSGGRYGAQTWLTGADDSGAPAPILGLSGFGGQDVSLLPASDTVIVRLGFNPDPESWDPIVFMRDVLPALGLPPPPE
jgi:CubicO group peptidase (beta-lactamase class C family)